MSAQVIAARSENRAQAGAGSSLSIAIDDANRGASWELRVYADLPDIQGPRLLGVVTTTPAGPGVWLSRIVAIATVPGAVGWRVDVRFAGGPPASTARIELSVRECCSAPGLWPINATAGPPEPPEDP